MTKRAVQADKKKGAGAKIKADKEAKQASKQQSITAAEAQRLQKKRQNSAITSPSEKKKTRAVDMEVLRVIRKRVPNPSDALLYGNIVEEKCMVEYVTEEKLKQASQGKYLKEEWWQDLFRKFSVSEDEKRPCQVIDKTEHVDPALVRALAQAKSKNCVQRSRAPLVSWFRAATAVNQRTICGIVGYLIGLKPAANEASSTLFIEFMKMVERLRAHQTFARGLFLFKHS